MFKVRSVWSTSLIRAGKRKLKGQTRKMCLLRRTQKCQQTDKRVGSSHGTELLTIEANKASRGLMGVLTMGSSSCLPFWAAAFRTPASPAPLVHGCLSKEDGITKRDVARDRHETCIAESKEGHLHTNRDIPRALTKRKHCQLCRD